MRQTISDCIGLLLGLSVLLGLAAPAASQNEATGRLYTRVDGTEVKAVLEIRVSPGWHLYHTEKGHPDAISQQLELTLGGDGITWGEPRLPEPERHESDYPEGTWDWVHYGKVVIHVLGEVAGGGDASTASATLAGLTCSDEEGTCIPYEEELTTLGKGRDKVFASFPAELVMAAAVDEPVSAEGSEQGSVPDPGVGLPLGGAALDTPGAVDDSGGWTPDFATEHVDARLFVRPSGERTEVVIHFKIDDGWHIYHGPTRSDLGPSDNTGKETTITVEVEGVDFEPFEFPAPERLEQLGLGEGGRDTWINGHHGTLVFRATGAGAKPGSGTARISGLTCSDAEGICLQFDLELEFAGSGPDEVFAASQDVADAGTVAAESADGDGEEEDDSLAKFLLLAVFWGLFTLLMPCTYPMIPITISFFTKQATARDGKVLGLSLAYGAGIVLIFILIGVVIGPPILVFAAHPVTNLIIGALFVFFAFVLFGAINLQPPAFLMNVAGKASMRGGYGGVFLMGATLVVTSFTCTAPFVGSLLAVGAEGGGGLSRIILGMGVFGLTMATPFVFLSLVPGKMQSLPKAGEWMDVLKVFLGFVELAAALKFLSNVDLMWDWGILSREVFLLLWTGIFLCAAMFLFGWIKLKGKNDEGIGPVRMVSGVATVLFSLYCWIGVQGFVMDDIMTAIIPNYSSERLAGFSPAAGGGGGSNSHGRGSHMIVVDDYEAAAKLAREQKKLLFVNFTGIT
ncbi:MAG: hypothetical protein GY711_20110 [bacterium]|nr:hypothetical protein [bacterium]